MGKTNYISQAAIKSLKTDVIKHEHKKLLSILDSIDEGVYVSDPATYKILYTNNTLKKKFGNVEGKICYEVFQGLKYPCSFCTNKYLFNGNNGKKHIWEWKNKTNKRWYHCIDRAIDWPGNGKVRLEVAIDITDRKNAQDGQINEKIFSASVVESSIDGIIGFDKKCRYTIWNSGMERISGLKKEKVLGRCAFEVFPFLKKIGEDKFFYEALKGKTIFTKDREFTIKKNGKQGFFEGYYSPIHNIEGNVFGGFAVIHDITKQKKSEIVLCRAEQRYRSIFENSGDAIYVAGRKGKLIDVNKAGLRLFGYTRSEIGEVEVKKLFKHAEDCKKLRNNMQNNGRVKNFSIEFCKKSGETLDCTLTANVRRSEKGTIIGYEGIVRDVTHKMQAEKAIKASLEKSKKIIEGTIQAMSKAVEMRDPYTAGHQRRVTKLACIIAKKMGLKLEQVEAVSVAGRLHDIGKIYVPAEILASPRKLSTIEMSMIKEHPRIGYEILKTEEFPWPIASIVLQHHERMDGSGYPSGILGKDIMIEARILAVADIVEAMASHRPYRPALGINKALEEILRNRGILYDSAVVDICIKFFKKRRRGPRVEEII